MSSYEGPRIMHHLGHNKRKARVYVDHVIGRDTPVPELAVIIVLAYGVLAGIWSLTLRHSRTCGQVFEALFRIRRSSSNE